MKKLIYLTISFAIFTPTLTHAFCELDPFKDDLFRSLILTSPEQIYEQEKEIGERYPGNQFLNTSVADSREIEWTNPDDFINIRYNKYVHLKEWDEIEGKKAKAHRVEVITREKKRDRAFQFQGVGNLETIEVGNPQRPNFAVIFIHGAKGNKTLGADDWSFGGNFNRLQNLVVNNGGIYYSPSVKNFKDGTQIGMLLETIKNNNPNAPIVIACGSAGGAICSFLQESQTYAPQLGGVIYLGTNQTPTDFTKIPSYDLKVPIVLAHGGYDPGLSWQSLKARFDHLKATSPDYPTQFYLYHGGIHGTPIRMLDWRTALNFIFTSRCQSE